jgi:hypothetical protein
VLEACSREVLRVSHLVILVVLNMFGVRPHSSLTESTKLKTPYAEKQHLCPVKPIVSSREAGRGCRVEQDWWDAEPRGWTSLSESF